MESIMQKSKVCYVCGTNLNLHTHHVIGGRGRRELSDVYGLTVKLCGKHHDLSEAGVHFCKPLDLQLKSEAEDKYIETFHSTHEKFIKVFGKSWKGEYEDWLNEHDDGITISLNGGKE